jgi:hypothetical protein
MKGAAQHTPGPWFISAPDEHGFYSVGGTEHDCDGSSDLTVAGDINGEDNARLIAAAPDLLLSITNLMNGIDTKLVRLETNADETLANALRDIHAAIAKAKGGAA